MSMKNPLTLAGIEPTTFRFVAQHLNHCATAVPTYMHIPCLKLMMLMIIVIIIIIIIIIMDGNLKYYESNRNKNRKQISWNDTYFLSHA